VKPTEEEETTIRSRRSALRVPLLPILAHRITIFSIRCALCTRRSRIRRPAWCAQLGILQARRDSAWFPRQFFCWSTNKLNRPRKLSSRADGSCAELDGARGAHVTICPERDPGDRRGRNSKAKRGRRPGPRMLYGWRCGSRLTAS